MNIKSEARFDSKLLEGHIPPSALRYLTHAIRPDAPLAHRAVVSFHGQVRLKPKLPWLSFHGQETIQLGQSFHVTSQSHLGPLPITTKDLYEQGDTSSRILLLGFIPVMTRRGKNAAHSAQSRLVVESTWLPTTFLPEFGARWTEKEDSLQVAVPINGEAIHVTIDLSADGGLYHFSLQRWSDLTDDGSYAWIPFASTIEAERTFGDYTVPSEIRSSWWAGTNREFEFFRTSVDNIIYSNDSAR
jgi:hypothetical protein